MKDEVFLEIGDRPEISEDMEMFIQMVSTMLHAVGGEITLTYEQYAYVHTNGLVFKTWREEDGFHMKLVPKEELGG